MILEGKIALVTGGSRGIGKAIAAELASQGADVIITYNKNRDLAEEVCSEISAPDRPAVALPLESASEESVLALFKEIKTRKKTLDILVSNAGATDDGFIMAMSQKKWASVIETNLQGTFLICRSAAKLMAVRRSGVIVNISSVAGILPKPGQGNYAASKAGIIAVSKVMAREFASHGIRVNVIAPGFIETDMLKKIPADMLKSFIEQIPLSRPGKAEEVAKLARFLVSDDASYITGQTFIIDGGLIC